MAWETIERSTGGGGLLSNPLWASVPCAAINKSHISFNEKTKELFGGDDERWRVDVLVDRERLLFAVKVLESGSEGGYLVRGGQTDDGTSHTAALTCSRLSKWCKQFYGNIVVGRKQEGTGLIVFDLNECSAR